MGLCIPGGSLCERRDSESSTETQRVFIRYNYRGGENVRRMILPQGAVSNHKHHCQQRANRQGQRLRTSKQRNFSKSRGSPNMRKSRAASHQMQDLLQLGV
jgi:hypothetical protein